jgi:hypothetical protein
MDCMVDDDDADPVSSLEHNMARKRKSYSRFKIDFWQNIIGEKKKAEEKEELIEIWDRFLTKYYWGEQIKKTGMGSTCTTHGRIAYIHKWISIEKPE